ncbi:hypothetical protein [Brevibacillus sp. BC25]|uniref:hypothetical protein n=1 Tax=Brevibacillus sp. BC25 TaxID=1144308 RepID=UPI000270EC87|nr:hypothetical protein [Brevibacillus sp. BC25]EJL33028.1 hypothetical protein PMI05_00011 [Brevibacillus sp. BC25]
MSKKKLKPNFKQTQKRFQKFIANENNQEAVFFALVNAANETLNEGGFLNSGAFQNVVPPNIPTIDVTDPTALLNAATNPPQEVRELGTGPTESFSRWAVVFLIIFVLFILLTPTANENADDD